MSVKSTQTHKKTSVSDGETVDKLTRGQVLFGVDDTGSARPFQVEAGGQTNIQLMRELIREVKCMKEQLAAITLHLNYITNLEE